jgi:anti-anti-sigma factor
MEAVTYITSMGISTIVAMEKSMKERGGTFIVTNLPVQIKKVFDIVAALPAMKIFESIEEADAYLLRMQQNEMEKEEPS